MALIQKNRDNGAELLEINESLQDLKTENEETIQSNNQKHQRILSELKEERDLTISQLKLSHQQERDQLFAENQELMANFQQEKQQLTQELSHERSEKEKALVSIDHLSQQLDQTTQVKD